MPETNSLANHDALKPAFGDIAKNHESLTRQHPLKRLFYRDLVQQFLQLVDPQPGERIADLACGNGFYGSLCLKRGAAVTFLDINRNMLDMVLTRHKVLAKCVVEGDICALPFENGAFDKTICLGAMPPLASLDEMARAIQEGVRVTRPGGRYFFTYNPPHPLRRLSVWQCRLMARLWRKSMRSLPFIDGRTSGMQKSSDMAAIVDRLNLRYQHVKAGLGVFGLICINV